MGIINKESVFLFIAFLLFIKSKYIVIPLKKYTYNSNENNNLLLNIYSNIYYTEVSIGSPKQTIITFINTTSSSNIGICSKLTDSRFYLENPNISKDYNYSISSTFYQIDEGDMKMGTDDLLIKDRIHFFTNFELTEEIKVENLSILYNPNNEGYILDDVGIDFIIEKEKKTTSGYIGFKLGTKSQSVNNNLLDQLKEKDIISNTIFTFMEVNQNNEKYKNNNIEYLLVIGEDIYDIFNNKDINKYISEKYDKKKYIEKCRLNDYIINEGFYFIWKVTFNNIYININNNNINMQNIQNVFLDQDYGLISGTKEYRDLIEKNFFIEYINKTKCSIEILRTNDLGSFYYYVCDSDININNFPPLFFKSNNFQYEFKLTENDLFRKDNTKIYFLIVFEFSRTTTWKLGKPFLEKYLFSYDYDAKTISFYNENLIGEETKSETNNDKDIKKYIIVIFVLLLIALVIGFLIGRYIYYQRKKKKALELDDSLNYDYIDESSKNEEKGDKLAINLE